MPLTFPQSVYNAQTLGPDATIDRKYVSAAITMTSGVLRYGYLRATKSETITSVRIMTHTTAAGATPTLVRIGVWSVSDADALTLVASTTNDTALCAGASTSYTKALTASFDKVAGQRYALGLLVVTGAAAPTVWGISNAGGILAEGGASPRITAVQTAQADLTASVADASLTTTVSLPYIALIP